MTQGKLPEQRMMERLLRENAVSSEMITRPTGQLAAFHRSSESSNHISPLGNMVAKLELRAIGASLDRLTPERKRYPASWQEGT